MFEFHVSLPRQVLEHVFQVGGIIKGAYLGQGQRHAVHPVDSYYFCPFLLAAFRQEGVKKGFLPGADRAFDFQIPAMDVGVPATFVLDGFAVELFDGEMFQQRFYERAAGCGHPRFKDVPQFAFFHREIVEVGLAVEAADDIYPFPLLGHAEVFGVQDTEIKLVAQRSKPAGDHLQRLAFVVVDKPLHIFKDESLGTFVP